MNRVQPITMAFATVLAIAGCTEHPRTYSTADGDRVLVEEDFSGSSLSPRWFASGPGASIERGHLHVEGLRNHPVWLTTPLPTNVQLEFDAWTTSDEGDIKFELAGDGQSFATTPNYRPTGYVFVFGGWNNSRSVIARLDEHAQDRVSRTDRKVRPNRRYHMVVTRRGGNIVWEIDGQIHLRIKDPDPLAGQGHEHFAFGGWDSPINFDNLRVLRLPEGPETLP